MRQKILEESKSELEVSVHNPPLESFTCPVVEPLFSESKLDEELQTRDELPTEKEPDHSNHSDIIAEENKSDNLVVIEPESKETKEDTQAE